MAENRTITMSSEEIQRSEILRMANERQLTQKVGAKAEIQMSGISQKQRQVKTSPDADFAEVVRLPKEEETASGAASSQGGALFTLIEEYRQVIIHCIFWICDDIDRGGIADCVVFVRHRKGEEVHTFETVIRGICQVRRRPRHTAVTGRYDKLERDLVAVLVKARNREGDRLILGRDHFLTVCDRWIVHIQNLDDEHFLKRQPARIHTANAD